MAQEAAEAQLELSGLATELMNLIRQPVLPRGREISRERWEGLVFGVLDRTYRAGAAASLAGLNELHARYSEVTAGPEYPIDSSPLAPAFASMVQALGEILQARGVQL